MSTVTTAAAALDAATTSYISALNTYINACSTANGAYRAANAKTSNARLDGAPGQALALLLSDGVCAGMLSQEPIAPPAPTLASQHAAD